MTNTGPPWHECKVCCEEYGEWMQTRQQKSKHRCEDCFFILLPIPFECLFDESLMKIEWLKWLEQLRAL